MTITRFKSLGLDRIGRDWSFYDITETNEAIHRVGPVYKTKLEALADLGDYAKRAGWEDPT